MISKGKPFPSTINASYSSSVFYLQKLSLGDNSKIGFSKGMSEGWIQIDKKAEGGPRIFKKVRKVNIACISYATPL